MSAKVKENRKATSSRVDAFPWYTSSLSDKLTKLVINGNAWKWSRSKMCLVVRAWLILVGSKWNIKLGYLSDIALVLWWRGIFERMISIFWDFERMMSTFWDLCPDFLSCCCSASSCDHCDPWILRVWLRCSVCLFSALLYQYRNKSAWKAIPGYPLKDNECLELYYIIDDLKQLPRAYYFLCQEKHTQIELAQS